MEPQLTPEQEDAVWAALDAVDAAGNDSAWLDAFGVLLDMQLALGLVTREELRAMSAPYLLDVIARADEFPEGQALLQKLRDDGMGLLNGDDYAERAGAALLIMSIDAVQTPRRHEARRARNERRQKARNVIALTAENLWACVDQGYWAREDVERYLVEAIDLLDSVQPHEGGDE